MNVTDCHRIAAKIAIAKGFYDCKRTNCPVQDKSPCDCDAGAIDGCKAEIEAIAEAIAQAEA